MKRDLDSGLAGPSHAVAAIAESDRAGHLSKQAMQHRINIIKLIDEVGRRHDRRTVFRDFVTMSAVALCNADLRQAPAREELYMQTVRKYSREEAAHIAHMFAELTEAIHVAPRDILGEIFMQLELGNSRMGQFFTPHHICELMAGLALSDDVEDKVARNGFITVHEPASGSGATIIAMMLAMQDRGLSYQRHVHVSAIDLDSTAAMMAYVQLSLMHVPAVITHGNTLTLEKYSQWYTPAHILDGWNLRLSQAQAQRAAVRMLAEEGDDSEAQGDNGPEAPLVA